MDEDTLERALERWQTAGVIDESTADNIRAIEQERPVQDGQRVRYVTIVGLMGAALVGAGILAFLAARWGDFSPGLQTAILVAAPGIHALAAIVLDRKDNPSVASATWLLAIVLIGPSLFLLVDLYAGEIAEFWVLVGWGLLAVPMGHAFESRPGIGLGLATLFIGIALMGDGHTGVFAACFFGTVVIAAGTIIGRDRTVAIVYRVVGVMPVIAVLLWLNTLEGAVHRVDTTVDPTVATTLLLAVLTAVGAGWTYRRTGYSRYALRLVIGPLLVTMVAIAIVELGTNRPAMLAYVLGQTLLLGFLLFLVRIAIETDSRALINLVAIGFFLQIVTLLLTVSDVLPGSLALVIAGIVLLLVAIVLERSRRQLLDRLQIG